MFLSIFTFLAAVALVSFVKWTNAKADKDDTPKQVEPTDFQIVKEEQAVKHTGFAEVSPELNPYGSMPRVKILDGQDFLNMYRHDHPQEVLNNSGDSGDEIKQQDSEKGVKKTNDSVTVPEIETHVKAPAQNKGIESSENGKDHLDESKRPQTITNSNEAVMESEADNAIMFNADGEVETSKSMSRASVTAIESNDEVDAFGPVLPVQADGD